MAEDSIATKTFNLVADEGGVVKFAHGFGNRPDTIISNNLGDDVSKDEFSPYALSLTGYDDENAGGVIFDRASGEPAPNAEISVELGAIYYG